MSLVSLGRIAVFILLPGVVSCSSGTGGKALEIHFGVAGGATVHNLQFYVHDIELLDEHGVAHPFSLAAREPWQSEQVALVDIAGEAGTQRNEVVRGTPHGGAGAKYTGIRFTVGVPFTLNHANPLTAAAPLDRGPLFWTWQSGYKFLRADFDESSFHLGSIGCSSASALRPPAQPCAQPNRMRVQLNGDPVGGVIRFNLATLVASAGACTGNYGHEQACAAAYASTGLQPETGVCADEFCSGQKLWMLD
jgi:uncharacterized repeat protein (TIGR04052 family)